jgi:hypothetical protein
MTSAGAAGATGLHAPRPVILSVTASPARLAAAGGLVTVTAHVEHAVRCTFFRAIIGPSSKSVATVTVTCENGIARARLGSGANTSGKSTRIGIVVRAIGSDGSSTVKTVSVAQAASRTQKSASPGLPVGLDACKEGPTCFYGPINVTYPSYGSAPRSPCGDCTFAAAAHWEQIVLGKHPDPTILGYEFAQAGGTLGSGLSTNSFFFYWLQNGIAGVPLTGLHAYRTDPASVESSVRTYTALLAQFTFTKGDTFGQYTPAAGTHMAVVDGFTPKGPLVVVSWGQTLQLTWRQWSSEVDAMWGVSNSASSKAGPGIAPTPPAVSASYEVQGCWTQYTGGSWSTVETSAATASFAGADIVARGPANFWAVVALAGDPAATISGAKVSLYEPNGQLFYTSALADWGTSFDEWQSTFEWTAGNQLFFQRNDVGQGTWVFVWSFPDGQTCESPFTVG